MMKSYATKITKKEAVKLVPAKWFEVIMYASSVHYYNFGGFEGIIIQGLGDNPNLYVEIDTDGYTFCGGQGNASPRLTEEEALASPYRLGKWGD